MVIGTIQEAARKIPIAGEYDLCVLGGSCTGVFAAVRAARLGLSVVIVERMGCFGGVATQSLVNIWHSPFDEAFRQKIFSGLTEEVMSRLERRDAVNYIDNNPSAAWVFNAAELQIELDELVLENRIQPCLHTAFVAPFVEHEKLTAVIVENKSGRSALKARFFIDATGDGDLCHRLGVETYRGNFRQPSTTCALFGGWNTIQEEVDWAKLVLEHGDEFGLPDGFAWGANVPGSDSFMLAGTRVYEDCSDADGFTKAEIEGRRQVRAIQDLLQKYSPNHYRPALQALPSRIGIRETRHIRSHHSLKGMDILEGKTYADAIANGSYRVDIHHVDKPGITFRYLDGRELYTRPGHPAKESRWRPELEVNPTYYQIPYRSLIPISPFGNLLAAGRFIDADEQAHAAIRVMVNMNQTGEAAGTAAYLALARDCDAVDVDADELRCLLQDGGSIML